MKKRLICMLLSLQFLLSCATVYAQSQETTAGFSNVIEVSADDVTVISEETGNQVSPQTMSLQNVVPVNVTGPEYYSTSGGTSSHVECSAPNVQDWIHINTAGSFNRKAGVTGTALAFSGSGSVSVGSDWTNFAFNYTNGVNPTNTTANSSYRFYTGKGSMGTFTAPAPEGITRTFEIYMGSWAAKEIRVTANMGMQQVQDIVPFTAGSKTGRLAKYSFTYTGNSNGDPLTVQFELTDDEYDTKWASLVFMGARILQEPQPSLSLLSLDSAQKSSSTIFSTNYSAADIFDWVHIDRTAGYNQMVSSANDRLTFSGAVGTGANNRVSTVTDWTNVKLSYTNGTILSSTIDNSTLAVYTGLNSNGTFSAPSRSGEERTLTIYIGSYAGTQIDITANMGNNTILIPPLTNTQRTVQIHRYVFSYIGGADESPLVVSFTLSNNSTDPAWANIGFYGAHITASQEVENDAFVSFTTVSLTGRESVVAPASGKTRRNVTAALFDSSGTKLSDAPILYSLKQPVQGVSIDENGVLYVSSDLQSSTTATVVAQNADNPSVFAETEVELVKDTTLRDIPPSPIDKPGWRLFYSEEFDSNTLDSRKWSDYYLRSWSTDALSKGHYFFDDGNLVLTAPAGLPRWSAQDGAQRVSGIQTFERQHLHRFGSASNSRELPMFDGFATKYGYFEIRMRLPDTKDGSHFAWWMVGTQDDQHPTASLSTGGKYPSGQYTNESAEFDIIEQTTDIYNPFGHQMNQWRPVIHPNGTQDLSYLWVPGTTIQKSAANEFHVYGFEWDETGTKFYLDGNLVRSTNRTPNYRMLTILSLYPGKDNGTAGMGVDRGIYPKDAIIDYFRVYKKDEPSKPTSVILNGYNSPAYLRIPETGSSSYQMSAQAIDQFDEPIAAEITWRFSANIQGYNATTAPPVELQGVSIDSETGVITVQSNAPTNQDLFVTAFVNDKVREVKHIKLSTTASQSQIVLFNQQIDAVENGTQLDLSAQVFDQYGVPMQSQILYQISQDHTGRESKNIAGVSVSANGLLTVSESVPVGTYIVITAKPQNDANEDRRNSIVLKVI